MYRRILCFSPSSDRATIRFGRQKWEEVTSKAQFLNINSNTFNTREEKARHQAMARAKLGQTTKARNRLEIAERAVDTIERTLNISTRWTEDSDEYREARVYVQNRKFIRAVEELERLVVQRLFELSKANLAGTGGYP